MSILLIYNFTMQYYFYFLFIDQTVDDFEVIDLPVLGLTNQVGQILRDAAAVSQTTIIATHHYIMGTSFL